MSDSNKAKKFNVIEIMDRLIFISGLFGWAFCITVIFYAGSMYNQVTQLTNSNKEMQADFKDLRKDFKDLRHDFKEIQISIDNKLERFETILRENIRDIKADKADISDSKTNRKH